MKLPYRCNVLPRPLVEKTQGAIDQCSFTDPQTLQTMANDLAYLQEGGNKSLLLKTHTLSKLVFSQTFHPY